MRKFKFFYYGLYAIFMGFSSFIALNYEDLVLNWDWDPINTWTGLIRYVLKLGGIGLVLLIVGTIVENMHIFSKNRKIKKLENEVSDLKAKLYDLSQEESSVPNETVVKIDEKEENPAHSIQEEQNDLDPD